MTTDRNLHLRVILDLGGFRLGQAIYALRLSQFMVLIDVQRLLLDYLIETLVACYRFLLEQHLRQVEKLLLSMILTEVHPTMNR